MPGQIGQLRTNPLTIRYNPAASQIEMPVGLPTDTTALSTAQGAAAGIDAHSAVLGAIAKSVADLPSEIRKSYMNGTNERINAEANRTKESALRSGSLEGFTFGPSGETTYKPVSENQKALENLTLEKTKAQINKLNQPAPVNPLFPQSNTGWKVTTYGPPGDRYGGPNSKSANIGPDGNQLPGDALAVSPDVEASLAARGIKLGDKVDVRLSDGTVVTRTLADRTAQDSEVASGKIPGVTSPLRNRVDFRNVDGSLSKYDGMSVAGITKAGETPSQADEVPGKMGGKIVFNDGKEAREVLENGDTWMHEASGKSRLVSKASPKDKKQYPLARQYQQAIDYGVDISGMDRDTATTTIQAAIGKIQDIPPAVAKSFDKLRGEMARNPIIKSAGISNKGFSNVIAGYQQQNGAGDMMMIDGFARLINPSMGVTGQMVSNFKDALPLMEKWFQLPWDKFSDGAKLTAEGRDMFMRAAEDAHHVETEKIKEALGGYYEVADAYGVPRDLVERAANRAYLVDPKEETKSGQSDIEKAKGLSPETKKPSTPNPAQRVRVTVTMADGTSKSKWYDPVGEAAQIQKLVNDYGAVVQ